MRKIRYIVLHCTAGPQTQKTSAIIEYWRKVLGWHKYGYHWIVNADGSKEHITPDAQVSNGVKGYNENAIHICYKGGQDGSDTRTPAQKTSLLELVRIYKTRFPEAQILGHRDLSPDLNKDGVITPDEWVKLCPCFDAKKEYVSI